MKNIYMTQRNIKEKPRIDGLDIQTDEDNSYKDQFSFPYSKELGKTYDTRPQTLTSRSSLNSFRKETRAVIDIC